MLRYLKLWQRYALVHRRRDARTLALLAHSDYFDPAYYLELYRDVAAAGFDPVIHYVDYGAAEMRNPSPYFNTAGYLRLRGDAFGSALNPLEHFLRYGRHDAALAAAAKETALKPKPLWEPTTSMYHGETSVSEKLPFRYVVYTAIVAGYDDLKLPLTRPPNCDFVVFSDAPLEAPGWKVLPINYLTRDPTRAARFVKLHPHLYFPEYSHSIWLDGNVGVRGDVGAFFERLTNTAFLSAFVHPLRDCIYQEGRECIIRRKDHAEVITQYLERLRARNIPEHLGLWESNVIVRRHNDRECISLMRAWWKELESGSRRDQLGLPVVLRDFPGAATPLDRPGISARQHPLLTFSSHRTQRKTRPSEAVWRASTASRPEVPPISVVVCVHNSLEVVRDCLGSLAIAHRPGDVIILVDDASDHPTASFLDDYARTQVGVRLIRNSETLGYTRSANLGMKAAQTQWIVLLNSDTVVAPNGLRKLVAAGRRHPRLAVVGPLSNAASWQSVPRLMGDNGKFRVNPLPSGFDVQKMDQLCERSALHTVLFVPLVNGFCLALRKDVLEEVGYFDEQSFPTGYGEEDDLCLRIAEAGYACGISTDSFVFHTKSATFTPERRDLLVAAGRKELERKHGAASLEAASSTLRNNPGLREMRQRLRSALEV